jgi:hypothetical protein
MQRVVARAVQLPRDRPDRLALRAITRISIACSWVNIDGTAKAVILTQVADICFSV